MNLIYNNDHVTNIYKEIVFCEIATHILATIIKMKQNIQIKVSDELINELYIRYWTFH